MSFTNIKIKGIGISLGQHEYDNEYFIKHFDSLGIEIRGLLKHLGREKRYRIEGYEDTSITLAQKASIEALNDSNVKVEDIDGIVFVTDSPEYLFPCNATYLSGELGTINAHMTFDMNSNCTGMLAALDTMTSFMKTHKNINKLLIVGAVQTSKIERKDCSVIHPNISDASVAIVLEKVEEDVQRGVINTNYYANANRKHLIMYPKCGFSHIKDKNVPENDKLLNWIPHDSAFIAENWTRMIKEILKEENLNKDNIDWYIFSQFSKGSAVETINNLKVSEDKHIFCGDKYGYTGNTSPFLALYTGLKENKIKDGDKILLSTLGAGLNMISVYYIY